MFSSTRDSFDFFKYGGLIPYFYVIEEFNCILVHNVHMNVAHFNYKYLQNSDLSVAVVILIYRGRKQKYAADVIVALSWHLAKSGDSVVVVGVVVVI